MTSRAIYFVGKGLWGLARNGWASLLAAVTAAVALFAVDSTLLLYSNLSTLHRDWSRAVRVSVFLRDTACAAEVAALRDRLSADPLVEGVESIDREQAKALFREQLGRDGAILDELKDNPLPASLFVRLRTAGLDLPQVEEFARGIEREHCVLAVRYGRRWIGGLARFLDLLAAGGACAAAFIFGAAGFVVAAAYGAFRIAAPAVDPLVVGVLGGAPLDFLAPGAAALAFLAGPAIGFLASLLAVRGHLEQ